MGTKMAMTYDSDLAAWASEQAALLRAGRLTELDIENLAAEIEGVGKREVKSLRSALREALEHLIKLQTSPTSKLQTDWKVLIAKQRIAIADLLADSPSLRTKMPDLFKQSWAIARQFATLGEKESGDTSVIPQDNPFTLDQLLDENFFPDSLK